MKSIYEIGEHALDEERKEVEIVEIVERTSRDNIIEIYDEKNDRFRPIYEGNLIKIIK